MDDLSHLIGMPEDNAIEQIVNAGYTCRIVNRDGNYFIVTRDYRLDRINLTITNGIITKITRG